jgi:hypothetical protein
MCRTVLPNVVWAASRRTHKGKRTTSKKNRHRWRPAARAVPAPCFFKSRAAVRLLLPQHDEVVVSPSRQQAVHQTRPRPNKKENNSCGAPRWRHYEESVDSDYVTKTTAKWNYIRINNVPTLYTINRITSCTMNKILSKIHLTP